MDEVEDLARKMHTLDIGDAAYSGCYTRLVCLAPAAAQAWAALKSRQLINSVTTSGTLPCIPLPPLPSSPNNQTRTTCFFCGGTHVIWTCAIASDYLRAGCIIRNGQYFAFTDQSRIRRTGNETLKQAIDARYVTAQASTPASGPNSIPLDNSRRDTSLQSSNDIPTTAFISESYFLQCTLIAENHAVVVTVEDKGESQPSNEVLAITLTSSAAHKRQRSGRSLVARRRMQPRFYRMSSIHPFHVRSVHCNTSNTASPASTSEPHPESKKIPPSFTYESKAADSEQTKRMFRNVLDSVILDVTIADLLAISPELRKEAVEHCRTQRVPTSTVPLAANIVATSPPSSDRARHSTQS
ncbi:hypothetical protein C8R48DRAFT_780815 [Suillus tomentosus]|nr:hypothetical protein C8R48DRAFT_780815 [Suillus tomentosus]